MKVVFFSFYFPPATQVGAKRAGAMCQAMAHNGYAVEIRAREEISSLTSKLTARRGHFVEPMPADTSAPAARARSLISKLRPSRYFRSLDATIFSRFFLTNVGRILKRRDGPVDIVVATYKPSANIVLGWLASKVYRAALVVDLRDLVSIFGRKRRVWFLHWLDTTIDRALVRGAERIIVVSPTQKAKAEAFYGRAVELIYNGTDSSEINQATSQQNTKEPYIFYAGTLSRDRDLARISAFLDEYNKLRDLKLYVASSQNPVQYGGHSRHIVWLGYLPRESVLECIEKSKGLVILEGLDASASENIPAKIYEYLGARKPVIADCYKHSDLVKILEETNCGAHISTYSDFAGLLDSENAANEEALQGFTRASQMASFMALIEQVST